MQYLTSLVDLSFASLRMAEIERSFNLDACHKAVERTADSLKTIRNFQQWVRDKTQRDVIVTQADEIQRRLQSLKPGR